MGVILIAFERESEQNSLEQLLAGRGHQVVRSANGLAALDAARRDPPHAVVSDIVLPRMDGFALCRKWKQDERLQTIPFLFYTRRHDDPKYERFALELGAERFLARSVQPEALLSALDELLVDVPAAAVPARPAPPDRVAAAPAAAPAATIDDTAIRTAIEKAQQAQARAQAQAQSSAQALEEAQQVQSRQRAQIAELEATNQRLAAGEARFRRVFEANPLPMWIADHATGGFIAVNDAALGLYGYKRAEFLGLKSAALEAPASEQPNGDSPSLRAHRRKDGGTIVVSKAAHEIEFDGRSADLVSAYDLSDRIAGHQQLQASTQKQQEELRTAVEKEQQALRAAAALEQQQLRDALAKEQQQRQDEVAREQQRVRDDAAKEQQRLRDEAATEQQRVRDEAASEQQRLREEAAREQQKLRDEALRDQQQLRDEAAKLQEKLNALEASAAVSEQQAMARQREMTAHQHEHATTLSKLQRADVALQGMIESLVRMSERHDPYTAGSARRLAALAVALGREAGLDGEKQHALRVAALLHDIGNIAVPLSILGKPAPLTEAEQALMRAHVDEGCQLLAEIDFGAPIADIVYQSHERYDGSGYPRGLKGEEILLEARILAIADTIEAMCSPRPYRPAATMETAINEINRAAGRLYDQQLVAACTRLVREHGFTLPE